MAGKFEIKKASDGRYMFNLKAGNGQVILTSQMYSSLQAAQNGIESVRTNAVSDERYESRKAKDGSPYFVLIAANHQEIGRSEMYTAEASRDKGIASVKANAADATVVELE